MSDSIRELFDRVAVIPLNGDYSAIVRTDKPRWIIVNKDGAEIARRLSAGGFYQDDEPLPDEISRFLDFVKNSDLRHGTKSRSIERSTDLVKSIYLEITSSCNYKCRYCYATGMERDAHMPLDLIGRVLGWLAKAKEPVTLSLSGGEPLLHPDFHQIVTDCSQADIPLQLVTNASLITASVARFLRHRGMGVQVSLDGPTPLINDKNRGEGSFNLSLLGLTQLLRHYQAHEIRVSVTLTRNTIDHFLEHFRYLMNLGIRQIHITQLNPSGRAKGQWPKLVPTDIQWRRFFELIHALQERYGLIVSFSGCQPGLLLFDNIHTSYTSCPLGQDLRLHPSGDVFPCQLATLPAFRIGNLFERSMDDLLMGTAFDRMVQDSKNRLRNSPKCNACEIRSFCNGGCLLFAYQERGSINGPDYLCHLRKEMFVKLLNQRLDRHLTSCQTFVARGDSMYPAIMDRERILITPVSANRIDVGNVFAYRDGDEVMIHRAISKKVNGNSCFILEKGDNCDKSSWISSDRIIGEAVSQPTYLNELK